MRRESIAMFLAFAVLAGCGGQKAHVVDVPDERGPSEHPKGPPRELSNGGEINLSLAQSYLKTGQLEMALDRANRAAASDPNSGLVHAMLGLINDRIGNAPRATEEFQRAIALSPRRGAVLDAYGTWLCSHGDAAGAAQQFSLALADPFYTSRGLAWFNAGYCLLRTGQPAQGEASLRRALDEPGADLDATLMALAQANLAQGKVLEARAFVQRRESMGATPEVLDLAARIEDAAGNAEAAARYRTRLQALDAHPSNGEAHP
jgi:type IV pilus assembly protein PilF